MCDLTKIKKSKLSEEVDNLGIFINVWEVNIARSGDKLNQEYTNIK